MKRRRPRRSRGDQQQTWYLFGTVMLVAVAMMFLLHAFWDAVTIDKPYRQTFHEPEDEEYVEIRSFTESVVAQLRRRPEAAPDMEYATPTVDKSRDAIVAAYRELSRRDYRLLRVVSYGDEIVKAVYIFNDEDGELDSRAVAFMREDGRLRPWAYCF